jgi:hypothetical protein
VAKESAITATPFFAITDAIKVIDYCLGKTMVTTKAQSRIYIHRSNQPNYFSHNKLIGISLTQYCKSHISKKVYNYKTAD